MTAIRKHDTVIECDILDWLFKCSECGKYAQNKSLTSRWELDLHKMLCPKCDEIYLIRITGNPPI